MNSKFRAAVSEFLNEAGEEFFDHAREFSTGEENQIAVFNQALNGKHRWVLFEYDQDKKIQLAKDMNLNHFSVIEIEGGEDQGSEYFVIVKLGSGHSSCLVRLNAYYDSYDGTEYQDWDFVESYEEVVTRYRKEGI